MDDEPLDIEKNRFSLMFAGIISLVVGIMFFIPGMYFIHIMILRFYQENDLPKDPFAFIFIFIIIAIGIVLLLLSYQFFSGKIVRKHIPTSLLIIVSIFFIAISTAIALEAFVFKSMPIGHQIGRGIGGGFACGGLGLWLAYKRLHRASNNSLHGIGVKRTMPPHEL